MRVLSCGSMISLVATLAACGVAATDSNSSLDSQEGAVMTPVSEMDAEALRSELDDLSRDSTSFWASSFWNGDDITNADACMQQIFAAHNFQATQEQAIFTGKMDMASCMNQVESAGQFEFARADLEFYFTVACEGQDMSVVNALTVAEGVAKVRELCQAAGKVSYRDEVKYDMLGQFSSEFSGSTFDVWSETSGQSTFGSIEGGACRSNRLEGDRYTLDDCAAKERVITKTRTKMVDPNGVVTEEPEKIELDMTEKLFRAVSAHVQRIHVPEEEQETVFGAVEAGSIEVKRNNWTGLYEFPSAPAKPNYHFHGIVAGKAEELNGELNLN